MKKVNMITTLSPEKQYEIRRWFWITTFLFFCLMLINAYYIVPKIVIYWHLKKQINAWQEKTKDYAILLGDKETLKKEHDEIVTHSSRIKTYQEQKKNPYQHIMEIVAACNNDVSLESMTFNKKDVDIEITSSGTEHAQTYIKRLSGSYHFSQVKMISLQQDMLNQQIRCKIRAHVIF